MRLQNILCAALAFITILLSAFFGASIHNAKTSTHITHLNELDRIDYFSADQIPMLSAQAAWFTLPLVITILVVEVIIILKSRVRQVKNIGIGLAVAALIILTAAALTLNNPVQYDFSRWGYVWITMSLFIVAGNALSVFIKGNADNKGKKV